MDLVERLVRTFYGMDMPAPIAIHQSLACEGVIRDLECEGCDDAACECDCHFDREEAPRHDPA